MSSLLEWLVEALLNVAESREKLYLLLTCNIRTSVSSSSSLPIVISFRIRKRQNLEYVLRISSVSQFSTFLVELRCSQSFDRIKYSQHSMRTPWTKNSIGQTYLTVMLSRRSPLSAVSMYLILPKITQT